MYHAKKRRSQVIHDAPTWQATEERWNFTPANDIVELHPAVFADVDRHNFAPEQQALHQHPGEGGHEEEVEQCSHHEACYLQDSNLQERRWSVGKAAVLTPRMKVILLVFESVLHQWNKCKCHQTPRVAITVCPWLIGTLTQRKIS